LVHIFNLQYIPLIDFTPPHLCACCSSQDLDFQRHMLWSFCVQWVQLRSEVIVRFVDIGGIDDNHCLFLFKNIDDVGLW